MPVTKSEIMYFGLGLALGAAAGSRWDKIKQALGPLLDSAGEGFGHAYSDVAEKFADMFETAQDAAAERRHGKRGGRARNRKPRRKTPHPSNNGRSPEKKARAADRATATGASVDLGSLPLD